MDHGAAANAGDTAARGRALVATLGCGACHVIPGLRTARGRLGPSLEFFGERGFIAGHIANTQENLVRWVMDAPSVDSRTAMPAFALEAGEANDIAAYLHTL